MQKGPSWKMFPRNIFQFTPENAPYGMGIFAACGQRLKGFHPFRNPATFYKRLDENFCVAGKSIQMKSVFHANRFTIFSPIFFERMIPCCIWSMAAQAAAKPTMPGNCSLPSAKTAPETCSSLPRNRSHSRANAPCFAASAPVGPRGCRCSALPASPIPCSRQFGGLAGKRLDDGGRTILMSLALEEMSDTLQLFRPPGQKR